MSSFLDKLKKGMGVDFEPEQELKEEKPEIKTLKSQAETETELPATNEKEVKGKENEITAPEEKKPAKPAPKTKKVRKMEIKSEKLETQEQKNEKTQEPQIKKEKWFEPEGQLAIDVYETDGELIIRSTIAGVKPEELDISIENDRVLITGDRSEKTQEQNRNYFYQECYWGSFSREIILPVETDPSRAQASMKEGVLTIRFPKIEREKKRKIAVKS